MTVALITGGRDYADASNVESRLSATLAAYPDLVVVQGGAKGADRLVRHWCAANGVPCLTIEACWDFYGKSAGGIRNGWMLQHCHPDFVIAFPGGIGTADMKAKARKKGVTVYEA